MLPRWHKGGCENIHKKYNEDEIESSNLSSLRLSVAATSAAASSHEDLKDDLLPLLTHKSTDHIHRMLSIADKSSQCYKDYEAMLQSTDYSSGMTTVLQSCPQSLSQTGDVYTVDYSVCDPAFTDSFTEVCNAANGQVVSGVGEFSMTCTGSGQKISATQKEHPMCIAASCDVTNWEADKDQFFDETIEEMKALFEGMGVKCTVNSAGKLTGMFALAVTSVAAAFFF